MVAQSKGCDVQRCSCLRELSRDRRVPSKFRYVATIFHVGHFVSSLPLTSSRSGYFQRNKLVALPPLEDGLVSVGFKPRGSLSCLRFGGTDRHASLGRHGHAWSRLERVAR